MSTGDTRHDLIVSNLPLVGYLASDMHARATHIPREDFAAVGALALVMAADAFDPSLGVPFGAYARRRILGAFADEMRSMDWATRTVRRRITETLAVRETLSAALGRTATADEIATAMGMPRDEVVEALNDATLTTTTLEDPSAQSLAADIPLPEETAMLRERRHVLECAIGALPERMGMIVRAVYFEERPIKEIAAELGVSHSAVSQQRSEAVRLLRDAMDRYFADGAAPAPTSRVSASARDAFFSRIGQAGGSHVAGVFQKGSTAIA